MVGQGPLTPERVREDLKCKGIRIREDWIQNWWDNAPLSSHVNISSAVEAVTDAFLRSNFAESAEGSVPLDVTLWHDRRLTGVHLVEVKEAVNISEPYKTQNVLSGKHRCLKFALSDGRHLFPAIEYRRIDCLKAENLGRSAKLLLCAGPVVRRGILFLQESNVHILWKGYFGPLKIAPAGIPRVDSELTVRMASFAGIVPTAHKQQYLTKGAVSHAHGAQCLSPASPLHNGLQYTGPSRSNGEVVSIDKSSCSNIVTDISGLVDLDDIADAVDVSAACCVSLVDKGKEESRENFGPLLPELLHATQKDSSAAANTMGNRNAAWVFGAVMKAVKHVYPDSKSAHRGFCWHLHLTDGSQLFSATATTDTFSIPDFQGLTGNGSCSTRVMESLEGYFLLDACQDIWNSDTVQNPRREVKAFKLHLPRDLALKRLEQLCTSLRDE